MDLGSLGYLKLLNIDVNKWSLDRRPRNPSIHERWHPTFHLETGALRPLMVTFAERARSQWGGAVSQTVPLLSISCRSAPPVHNSTKLRI
jgi:hypothetical protein